MKTTTSKPDVAWRVRHLRTAGRGNLLRKVPRWKKLSMAVIACLLSLSAYAQYESGAGTSTSPYLIKTKAQLDYFRAQTKANSANTSGKYFKLTADIDYGGGNFEPIGTNGVPFLGTFDGGGFRVSSFYIDYPTRECTGFFGVAQNATIKNLTLYYSYIKGANYSGGLIGEGRRAMEISNCHVTISGSSEFNGHSVGGFVGKFLNDGGKRLLVENCSFTGNLKFVSSPLSYYDGGGFVGHVGDGYDYLVFKDCYVKADISIGVTTKNVVGGFIGGLNDTADLIRCVQVGSVPASPQYSRGYLVGYMRAGKTLTGYSVWVTDSPYKGSSNGTLSGRIYTKPSTWRAHETYTYLERSDNLGFQISSSTRGNERWGTTVNSPILASSFNPGYTVAIKTGSNIGSATGQDFLAGGYYYTNSSRVLKVYSSPSPTSHQRAEYTFTPDYSPESGAAYSASTDGYYYNLTPKTNGTVAAKIINIPYPYVNSSSKTEGVNAVFNQWTSKVTLSGMYDNTDNLTGKLYIYKRVGTSGSWAREAESISVATGSYKNFSKEIVLGVSDLEKNWQYSVVFIEGTGTPPTDPGSEKHKATVTVSTVTSLDLSSFTVLSGENDVTVKFKVDTRLINSSSYKYTIQSNVNGGAFTDWLNNRNFSGTASAPYDDFYVHADNRMSSPCDIYGYKLLVNAFGRTFTSEVKTGSKTGSTKFDDTQVFKATKGEHANFIRLSWKVKKDQVGSPETYRVFRRVANTSDPFMELETVTSSTSTVYWNDNNALTGIYYQYKVVLYQICSGVESYSDERLDIGFTQAFGTVSGRVTYGTGSSVSDVQMLVCRNELQEGESQYRSLKSMGGGQSFEWKARADYFNDIWTAKKWTFQFWINPNVTNTGSSNIIGYIGSTPIYLNTVAGGYQVQWMNAALRSEVIRGDRFSHISIVRDGNTLKLYTVCDQLPDSIYIKNSTYAYSTATALTEANTKISLGHSLKGNVDDTRFWKAALSEADIKRTYSRYIIGNESSLVGYWTFDEGLSGYAFDRSRVGTVYNGNHATTNTLTIDMRIPDDYQLALKGITDNNGNFQINGIPYSGEGTSYSIVPSMGVHQFNPTQQLRYISPTSMVHNATDFSDISSFSVSGTVLYEGGTYPVADCTFTIDGQPVTKNGELVKSNFEGKFDISVPIGIHEVKVVKQGHTFADGGLLLENGQNMNYNRPVAGIKFFDRTKVKLIGRVTGGVTENDKVLGFGESKNNIGVRKLILETTRKQYKFVNGQEITETVLHNQGEWKKTDKLQQDSTRVIYKADQIEINVSPVTGEFMAWVYPEPYNIADITVPGANSTKTTIYANNEMIDLTPVAVPDASYMKTSIRNWQDSVLVSRPGMVDHYQKVDKSDTIRYHAEWKFYYQSLPTFSVTQLGSGERLNYFGDKTIEVKDELTGKNEAVALWANNKYLFNNPVFSQGKEYTFELQAYERYIDYTRQPADTTVYPVADGEVSMTNNLRVKPEPENILLNASGKAIYTFMVGAPDLTTAKNNFFATVRIGSVSYLWDRGQLPVETWHLGDRSTGTDFMTSGPDELSAILRDPPGSRSYAYIEKGTTVETVTRSTVVNNAVETLNSTFSLGAKLATFVGLGAGVITDNEVTNEISAGLETSQQWTKETEKIVSTTFTERFQTSDDPLYVGHLGDVFIGNSTNIQYGLTNGVAIQKGTPNKPWITVGQYSIVPSVSMAYGQTFATRFAYTQVELENIMIPKWEQVITNLLRDKGTTVNPAVITAPVYVSKLDKTHENYGKKNSSSSKDPYNGDSYQIVFPTTWKSAGGAFTTLGYEKMKTFQDSILWANNQINGWMNVLKRNEKEKVEMKHLGNYSIGSGASIENSATTTNSTTITNDFTWVISPSTGLNTGFKIAGVGVAVDLELSYSHQESNVDSEKKENVVTSGFVLQEEGDDDQITVDYGSTASGTIAFKTRGGRTSCPYEGEARSKYYQPGQHILSEGTMQIEVPKISIASAPEVINVPANKTANFVIDMKNESETGEDVWFQLIADEKTNPNGAELKIDGGVIGNGRMFLVKAGEVLKKTLTLGKGSVDNYERIALVLRSQCQHDPTDFLPDIADTTYITARFIPGCSDVRIKEPSDKWIVNSSHATGDTLYVTIDNYDVNYPNFGYISLQYRLTSSPAWSTITTFYPPHLYAKAQGVKENIGTRPAIVYPWKMPNVDGAYELRAVTASVNSSDGLIVGSPLSTYATEALIGYKDVTKPTALGLPSPANGILSASDELSITFNEDIQTGLLTDNNFSISGVLNAQTIAEPNVGLTFTGTQLAQTELPVYTDGSFSIETWFKRTPASTGTLFAYGQGDNFLSLAFDASNKVILKIGTESYTSATAIANDDTWKYIAMAYNRSNNTVSVYEFEGATNKLIFADKQLTAVPETQGRLYVGNNAALNSGLKGTVAHLHMYGVKRTQSDVAATKSITKSGREYGLIGYWNMEEGEGNVAADKARSRHLVANTNWYIYPSGRAKLTNGSTYLVVPTATYSLDAFSDFTLEFWFRSTNTSQTSKTLLSADKGSVRTTAAGGLALYKPDGTVNQVLTTANLLDTKWHHFALSVKRNGNVNAYVDGVNTASFSETLLGSFASGNYYFGALRAANNTYSNQFNGSFDEIRIWNAALTRENILLNKNSKLNGKEAGLQAYYPFETYTQQSNGLITVTNSDLSETDGKSISGTATTTTDAKAVKDVRKTEPVPFTFVASSNKVVFTLDERYFSRVEGTTLNITASDIRDARNNKSNTESWIAYVNRNTLLWDSEALNLKKERGESLTVTARIVNTGGTTVSYAIENLPSWLHVNSASGNLKPLASKELILTADKGMNIGSYEGEIGLSSGNGVVEILPVQLKVVGQRPEWSVNSHDYESTMNITGRIQIMGVNQEDSDDLLGAFIDGKCVGVSSPKYVAGYNSYYTFMNIYGNSQDSGKEITLKLWDASTGNIYPVVESRLNSDVQELKFAANAIKGDNQTPVTHNALDVVQQSITLGSGWNWISFNVANSTPSLLQQFKSNVGDAGRLLKSQSGGYIQNPSWVGDLTSLNNTNMYLLNTTREHTLLLNGQAVKPATTPVSLAANGWTWIGYTPQFTLPTNDALAGLNPQVGDQIKGHSGYRTYMGANGWIGNLDYMSPGCGYMYYSKSGTAKTLTYPQTANQYYRPMNRRMMSDEAMDEVKYWNVNAYQYPNNMTITGYLVKDGVEVQSESIEIAAFVGNECRGSARLNNMDGYNLTYPCLGFLMIYGEQDEQLQFKAYDHATGKEYNVTHTPVTYATNSIIGDPEKPFRFTLGAGTGFESSFAQLFRIFPNPVRDVLHIDYRGDRIDLLEITSPSGQTLFMETGFTERTLNVDFLTEGLYILKLTVNEKTHVFKFIKE